MSSFIKQQDGKLDDHQLFRKPHDDCDEIQNTPVPQPKVTLPRRPFSRPPPSPEAVLEALKGPPPPPSCLDYSTFTPDAIAEMYYDGIGDCNICFEPKHIYCQCPYLINCPAGAQLGDAYFRGCKYCNCPLYLGEQGCCKWDIGRAVPKFCHIRGCGHLTHEHPQTSTKEKN